MRESELDQLNQLSLKIQAALEVSAQGYDLSQHRIDLISTKEHLVRAGISKDVTNISCPESIELSYSTEYDNWHLFFPEWMRNLVSNVRGLSLDPKALPGVCFFVRDGLNGEDLIKVMCKLAPHALESWGVPKRER